MPRISCQLCMFCLELETARCACLKSCQASIMSVIQPANMYQPTTPQPRCCQHVLLYVHLEEHLCDHVCTVIACGFASSFVSVLVFAAASGAHLSMP